MNELTIAKQIFPKISSDILTETERLVSELQTGKAVIESGWVRLYLIYKDKVFLTAKAEIITCGTCNTALTKQDSKCWRCGGTPKIKSEQLFPTLESYIEYIAEQTGKSRQTIFNRLAVYRMLTDEYGVPAEDVFAMNLISATAAMRLARLEKPNDANLVNDSWPDTIRTALSFTSKSEMIKFIRHDILNEPQYYTEILDDKTILIHREIYTDEIDTVVENYSITLDGEWPVYMLEWIKRKLGIKQDNQ